jgi:hypothetical protein
MSGDTASPVAFPFDIILACLELLCFSSQICRLLQGDPNCRRLEFWCHQIAFVKDIAESRYNIPISINALTRAFDCPRFRVQAALAHRLDDPGQRGKHITIDWGISPTMRYANIWHGPVAIDMQGKEFLGSTVRIDPFIGNNLSVLIRSTSATYLWSKRFTILKDHSASQANQRRVYTGINILYWHKPFYTSRNPFVPV